MLIVNSKETLLKLVEKKHKKVSIKLNSFSNLENKELEEQINFLINDCGCNSGRSLLLILLPVSLVISTFFYVFVQQLSSLIIFFFITHLIIGIIGKLSQKRKNNKRLKQVVTIAYNKLKNREKCQ